MFGQWGKASGLEHTHTHTHTRRTTHCTHTPTPTPSPGQPWTLSFLILAMLLLVLARRGMTRYSITRCGKVRGGWELIPYLTVLTWPGLAEPAHLRTVRTASSEAIYT